MKSEINDRNGGTNMNDMGLFNVVGIGEEQAWRD